MRTPRRAKSQNELIADRATPEEVPDGASITKKCVKTRTTRTFCGRKK